ncbi:MAG: phosphoglycerate kinase [Bacteroidetes bacterium]|nr:MAG: phosphoglycerate kinase [Bacteroidota bacterium]
MKTIDNVNFKDRRAIIRVDFNVPLDEKFNVTDDTRIRAAIPTIQKILSDGGSAVLMSHLGRPKGGYEEKFSLKHIVTTVEKLLSVPVKFASDSVGDNVKNLALELKAGEVLLLENLRFHKQETTGTESFAQELASLGDIYVNDAFGTAHRAHASTTIIAKFFPKNKCFGYVMAGELVSIHKVLTSAEKPFTAIMGGAKVSGKILIIEKLLDKIDNLLIGGGMAYTFIKAQGGKIGSSLVEEDKIDIALKILSDAKAKSVNIYIPVDTIAGDGFSNDAKKQICDIHKIPDGWIGLDIGPATENIYKNIILKSKTILWNGPMGVFEMSSFEHGTQAVALAVAEATGKGSYTLIGGGDSVAAINKYKLADKVSYVSTGGGALLKYIESGTLPGVEAIEK